MRGRHLFVILFLASLALAFSTQAAAQGFFPLFGWPIPTTSPSPPATPVAPPPPSMMPPAPPPAGNTFVQTGGISEYGGTISGGTVLTSQGTDLTGGPAMAMPESPLAVAPYAPVLTQTDEILRGTYPSGSVGTRRVAASYGGMAVAPGGTAALMPAPVGLPESVPVLGLGRLPAPATGVVMPGGTEVSTPGAPSGLTPGSPGGPAEMR